MRGATSSLASAASDSIRQLAPLSTERARQLRGAVVSLPRRRALDQFPASRAWRIGLQLLFMLPFALTTVLVHHFAGEPISTVNDQLIDRIQQIPWAQGSGAWLNEIFPPVSTVLALAIPGGALGLGLAGSIVAGLFLHRMLEIMHQRGVPLATSIVLVLALGANPLFAYAAVENLPGILGMTFFGVGLAESLRFITYGHTRSGFMAGILFLLAVFSQATAIVYVLCAALATPFLRNIRAGQVGAKRANALVLIFPTIASLLTWYVLVAVFNGAAFVAGAVELFAPTVDRFISLGALFTTLNGALLFAPLVSASIIALAVRRPAAILASGMVFVSVLLGFGLGLVPTNAAGNTFILLTTFAMVLVPRAQTRAGSYVVFAAALLQIVIGWVSALNRPIVIEWIQTVDDGVTRLLGG